MQTFPKPSKLLIWAKALDTVNIGIITKINLNVFCITYSWKKLVLLQGLEGFIVVDTKDVLMICKKNKEQEIKEYVAEIKRNKGDKYI